MAEEEVVDFSKLSLEDRCAHKNWKARVSAYEELIKLFKRIDDEKSPEWSRFAPLVRKFPADTHFAAQEKGMEATLLFLEHCAQAGKIVGEVVSSVITKGLIASKARSKELSADITMMCIEIEKYEVVQDELMKGMDLKNPKVVAATIGLTTSALRDFGPKVFNLKLLLKKLPGLIEDRDRAVRDETKKLIVEFYRWIGSGFDAHMTFLKPTVMAEIKAEYEKFEQKPQQVRFLKSQQARKERQAAEAIGEDQDDGVAEVIESPEIDPYELLEPVNILSQLPEKFVLRVELPKWQDRKEVLDQLLVLLSNPKLEPGEYGDLVRILRKLVGKDTNVYIVAIAGKCITGLANGLKKKFSPWAPMCISTIVEKFKEKKPQVLASMREAADACYAATSLEQIQEDIVQALGNKNPTIKLETSLLLARAFSKTPNKIMTDKKIMKPYLTAILTNVNESDPTVRDAASEAFGVAMKAIGEKAISPYLQDLEPSRLQKIKEFAEKAVVQSAPAVKQVPRSAPVSSRAEPKVQKKNAVKKPVAKKPSTAPHLTSSQEDYFGPAPVRQSKAAVIKVSPKPSPSASPTPMDDKNGPVDISPHITTSLIEKLSDKSWKIREDHLDKVSKLIENRQIQPNLNDLPQALGQRLQDSNRNIALNAILICGNLANALGPNAKQHVRTVLPNILSCLCDNKTNVRSNVVACMNAWAENAGVHTFFQGECIYDALKGNNPYLRQELFNWLAIRLPEVKNISKDELNICIPILFASIEDRNPDVRKSAQDVIPAFMMHLGYDTLSKASSKLKPASKMVVQALVDKHKPPAPEKPSKHIKGNVTYRVEKKSSPVSTTSAVSPNSNGNPSLYHGGKTYRAPDRPGVILPSPDGKKGDRKSAELKRPETYNIHTYASQEELEAAGIDEPYVEVVSNVDPPEVFPAKSVSSTGWPCPPQYQIDFEKFTNMFGPEDLEPIPPLQLYETNIEFVKNEPPMALPKRRTSHHMYQVTDMYVPPKASQSIDLVVSQVSAAEVQVSLEAVVQLDAMLNDPEVANVMYARIDPMLAMVSSQLQRSRVFLQSQSTRRDKLLDFTDLNKLFCSIVQLLQSLYKGYSLPMRATRETLKELIYQMLCVMIEPNLKLLPDADAILTDYNILVCRIIERSDPNSIYCALVQLLNEIVHGTHPARMLELTMKCQWKLLKQVKLWTVNNQYGYDVECFIKEFCIFTKNHPYSSFTESELAPLKTMKTIIHTVLDKLGVEVVDQALSRCDEYRNTEGAVYLTKLVQRELLKPVHQRDGQTDPPQANNNVEEFFAKLPKPEETAGNNKTSVTAEYMRRLKMIKERGGLDKKH